MSNKLSGGINSGSGKVDLRGLPLLKCDKCEGEVFKQVVFIKKMSALLSPNGKEILFPVQAFACDSCGHINKEVRAAFDSGEVE